MQFQAGVTVTTLRQRRRAYVLCLFIFLPLPFPLLPSLACGFRLLFVCASVIASLCVTGKLRGGVCGRGRPCEFFLLSSFNNKTKGTYASLPSLSFFIHIYVCVCVCVSTGF
uniref:Uncharacterized protein n=1 Tax=Trypanosoma congolense (strain IL3000) TaxID=1068625 RepID=G0USX6_TRYCI|nr:hypothetical protein, unlikely [Trypanosoma congolense IL3000]